MSELDSRNEDDMGRAAYEAYCESVGWKAFNGDPLPQYTALQISIRTGWVAAARAVATAVRNEHHG